MLDLAIIANNHCFHKVDGIYGWRL